MRRRLPDTRRSLTHKFNVAGHEGYLTVGLYDDGKPGELFITMAKEGSTIGGLMDSLGTATSVALQYGVPIESLVNKFTPPAVRAGGHDRRTGTSRSPRAWSTTSSAGWACSSSRGIASRTRRSANRT
jgi:hypothetical protein